MSVTADDPDLARIGYLAAVTNTPPSVVAKLSDYEQFFWKYWKDRITEEQNEQFWRRMGRTLGTLWYKSDVENDPKVSKMSVPRNPNEAFYPLSILISQNSILKQIRKDLSSSKIEGYVPQEGEEVVEMGDMSVDEFKAFMGRLQAGFAPPKDGE